MAATSSMRVMRAVLMACIIFLLAHQCSVRLTSTFLGPQRDQGKRSKPAAGALPTSPEKRPTEVMDEQNQSWKAVENAVWNVISLAFWVVFFRAIVVEDVDSRVTRFRWVSLERITCLPWGLQLVRRLRRPFPSQRSRPLMAWALLLALPHASGLLRGNPVLPIEPFGHEVTPAGPLFQVLELKKMTLSQGDCLCQQGEFWHRGRKACVRQFGVGNDCTDVAEYAMVCKDGLVCKSRVGSNPSCLECEGAECATGAPCLKEFKLEGEACATIQADTPATVAQATATKNWTEHVTVKKPVNATATAKATEVAIVTKNASAERTFQAAASSYMRQKGTASATVSSTASAKSTRAEDGTVRAESRATAEATEEALGVQATVQKTSAGHASKTGHAVARAKAEAQHEATVRGVSVADARALADAEATSSVNRSHTAIEDATVEHTARLRLEYETNSTRTAQATRTLVGAARGTSKNRICISSKALGQNDTVSKMDLDEASKAAAAALRRAVEKASVEAVSQATLQGLNSAQQAALAAASHAATEAAAADARRAALGEALAIHRKEAKDWAAKIAEAEAKVQARALAKDAAARQAGEVAESEALRKATKAAEAAARQEAQRIAQAKADAEARRNALKAARREAAASAADQAAQKAYHGAAEAAQEKANQLASQKAEARAKLSVARAAAEEAAQEAKEKAAQAAKEEAREQAETAAEAMSRMTQPGALGGQEMEPIPKPTPAPALRKQ
ncbi:unnamed protein product [Effrenium voratum]|nr:unnamed protein product [Effrenium voratum]